MLSRSSAVRVCTKDTDVHFHFEHSGGTRKAVNERLANS